MRKQNIFARTNVNGIEEQKRDNSELQVANEKLLNSNVEMQDAKEEMQSAQVELERTIEKLNLANRELLNKQEHTNAAHQYSEAIIATLREPFLVLDKSLNIRTANVCFYKKFKISRENTKGKLIYEIRNGLFNSPELRSLLEEILPKRTQLLDYEISLDLFPNKKCTLLLNAWQIVNEKEAEKLIHISFEDITQSKLAEERKKYFIATLESAHQSLQSINKELEKVNRSKDKFISMISHDLKNPLAAIILSSDIMKKHKKLPQKKIKSFAEIIHKSSTTIVKQLEELVEWAIQKERIIHFNPQIRPLHDFVEFSTELLEDIANQKDISIINNIDKEIKVYADPMLLRSILQNLITNSLKFTPSAGTVSISAMISGESVEVAISDTGKGMTEELRSQLFNDEVIWSDTDEGNPTSGLGLLLVKDFVERHKGKLRVESSLGNGSSFYFTLPLSK